MCWACVPFGAIGELSPETPESGDEGEVPGSEVLARCERVGVS